MERGLLWVLQLLLLEQAGGGTPWHIALWSCLASGGCPGLGQEAQDMRQHAAAMTTFSDHAEIL